MAILRRELCPFCQETPLASLAATPTVSLHLQAQQQRQQQRCQCCCGPSKWYYCRPTLVIGLQLFPPLQARERGTIRPCCRRNGSRAVQQSCLATAASEDRGEPDGGAVSATGRLYADRWPFCCLKNSSGGRRNIRRNPTTL